MDPGAGDHRKFMEKALDEARRAMEGGEVPVGACVVIAGEIVATACNSMEGDGDPTCHAEIKAIRMASKALGRWRLPDCTIYVTLEPCAMCSGAIVQARMGRLVYGARDDKAGASGSLYDIPRDFRLNHFVEVIPGVMEDEASALLRDFFNSRR